MRALPLELRTLSLAQAGLLTSRQLLTKSFRRRDVEARIRRGDWQRVTQTIIATHTQPLTRLQQLWAAALHFERRALAGPSALELLGMPMPHDERIHLIGPRMGVERPHVGCTLHTATADPDWLSEPARVAPLIAATQALRWARTDRQAVFQVIWAMQHGFFTIAQLQDAMDAVPPSHGTSAARRRLGLIDPGVHSIHEFDFAKECARRGFPPPVRQRQRLDSTGHVRYTDVEFQVRGRIVVVEIDGLGHLAAEVQIHDQWRANELLLQGAPVLRIPAIALRLEPDRFFEQLRRILRSLELPPGRPA